MMRKQLAIARPAAKQAWAAMVKRKIENQAACLRLCDKKGVERVESYARRVRSGDPDNLEGQAAAFYFSQLFGPTFYRTDEFLWTNAALNYGYAVLRGAITRGLVAHGLHPTIGLFHDSEQNAFNLADDLIEAFRPLVDLHVAKCAPLAERDLMPEDKQALVALLNIDVGMSQGHMSVLSAIEYAVESLVRTYESAQTELDLPHLIGLEAHQLEH
jgi:CRISPR-associated protein Cas1